MGKNQISKASNNKSITKYLVMASIIMLVVSVSFYVRNKNSSPIPDSATSQLNFKPVVAGAQKTITKPTDISVNQNSQILSYKQQFEGVNLFVSQQLASEQYIDFPDRLETQVRQLGLDQIIQSGGKQIFIIREDNKQTAISLLDKVLIKIQADKPLDDTQWQQLFGSLKLN